jgi:ABC-type branched-subunit amino acid transport system ATPase component
VDDIIEMNRIVKIFPPSLIALDDVSVTFRKGEIHAIVGENGAGKSTLMKILYGMHPADSGEIILTGKKVKFLDPGESILAGIGMVHPGDPSAPVYCLGECDPWINSKIFDRLDVKKAVSSQRRLEFVSTGSRRQGRYFIATPKENIKILFRYPPDHGWPFSSLPRNPAVI